MKHVPILVAIVLGIVLLIQHGTDAGGNPPPRSVPVIVQDVMKPSSIVAVSVVVSGGPVQLPVPLQVGQVFVLTSWSVSTAGADGLMSLTEGLTTTIGATRASIYMVSPVKTHHQAFSTGIRFPRDVGGLADAYVGGAAPGVTVSVQGYITDDF